MGELKDRLIERMEEYFHSHDNIGGGILVEDGVKVLVEGNDINANYLDATADEWLGW